MIKVVQILLVFSSIMFFTNVFIFDLQASAVSATDTVNEAIKNVETVEKRAGLFGQGVEGSVEGLQLKIGSTISILMGLTGTIALIVFFYGGIMWMLAEGNAEGISKAKKTMIWAAIGLVAIFLSGAALSIIYGFALSIWGQ